MRRRQDKQSAPPALLRLVMTHFSTFRAATFLASNPKLPKATPLIDQIAEPDDDAGTIDDELAKRPAHGASAVDHDRCVIVTGLRKRIAGQTEMLLPIAGKKGKEAVSRPASRQRKAG
jgi:hypothetical protein